MNFFNEDVSIYGEYARIIKKYSKTSDTDGEEWKISNGIDNAESVKIFSSYIDCLYAGAAIGLADHKKISDSDPYALDRKKKANILQSAWKNRRKDFLHLYSLMVLTDPDIGMDKDQRVKKAFSDVPDGTSDHEFAFFLQYAYGGLEEMDKELSAIRNYKELSDYACRTILRYKGEE
jgi:hypothetical protein